MRLLLAPIDRKALVNVVERAAKAKIPVMIFDSGIDTDSSCLRSRQITITPARLAAQRMGEILGGKGTVAMTAVQAGAASTMAREQGFEDFIQKNFPGIQIIDKRYGDAEVAKSSG